MTSFLGHGFGVHQESRGPLSSLLRTNFFDWMQIMLGICRPRKHFGRLDIDIQIKGGVGGIKDWGSGEWKKKKKKEL